MKMKLASILAAALLSTSAMAEEQLLEQRGYGTWAFTSYVSAEGNINCSSTTAWPDSENVWASYYTIGGDLLEEFVFHTPVPIGEVHDFNLAFYKHDGSFEIFPMPPKIVGPDFVAVDMTDEVYWAAIDSEKFAIAVNDHVVASGWLYPEAFEAVRGCRAAAAIMEGMGMGEGELF